MTAAQRIARLIPSAVLACVLFLNANTWADVNFYAADKEHLWNRLYAGLIVRERKGVAYDDLIDPPYYTETTHLLSGEPHTAALALLREFIGNAEASREMSPLKRAVMQRDLVALVHWLAHAKAGPEQQALAKALVQAVRFVALSSEEIAKLPDNYVQAVAKSNAAEFDPKQPTRPFLPPDLLSEKGPWLSVEPSGPDDLQVAPVHSHAFGGRSVLEVRFRHADGREAGEKYLKELVAMPRKLSATERAAATPQFPPGSMWALVRRAILIDAQGQLVVSPLTESVELRFYRKIAQDFAEAQAGFEWELSRRLLFGDGGFHQTDGRDQFFTHFFDRDRDKMIPVGNADPRPGQAGLCMSCHLEPGILSVKSHTREFRIGQTRERPDLRPTTREQVAKVALELAGKRGAWLLVRKLWDEK